MSSKLRVQSQNHKRQHIQRLCVLMITVEMLRVYEDTWYVCVKSTSPIKPAFAKKIRIWPHSVHPE